MQDSVKQIARYVALGALFLLPLAPLIVTSSFFFPFITGKGFYLRILIEIAVTAWIVLAILDKAYRPRISWIGIIFGGFVLWMFVADSFAANPAKAFWSNFERMEGWVYLAHLLSFFFAASNILRVEQKWRAWFLTSLGVSLVVSAYALLQLAGILEIHQGSTRIDATLGNSAYLAVYFIFSIFIAAWLALTEKRPWLSKSLIAFAVLESVLLFYTETRGAMLGFIFGLFLAAFLTMVTGSGRARRAAAWATAAIVLVVGSFYFVRDTQFVQGNHILQRIASISLADAQTRFTIWGMAWEGFKERPMLGWGQEGFNYVFNKYYEPSLYRQEMWFDRAHNAFIDWLSAGGLPAFILYISLFISAIALLWRRSELSRPERILLTAALAGYAAHNMFIFDNLYSYIYFFAVLALIDSQTSRPIKIFETAGEPAPETTSMYVAPVALAVAVSLIWAVNIPGMRAANTLVYAISPLPGSPTSNVELFEELVKRPAFAAQEIREQLTDFANNLQVSDNPAELKQRAAVLSLEEMGKQVASYPDDARERLQLAHAYRYSGRMEEAREQVEAALALSPRKQLMWIEAGGLDWESGKIEAARDKFITAYELSPQFEELAPYAAAGYIIAGEGVKADALLLKSHGTTTVDSELLNLAYNRAQDWPHLISLWKLRLSKDTSRAQNWFGLAGAYFSAGNKAAAIRTIREMIEMYPEAAQMGEAAIYDLQKR